MIEKFADMKQLSELATVLNKFNSEAVQVRLLDFVLGKVEAKVEPSSIGPERTPLKASRRKAPHARKPGGSPTEKRRRPSSGTGANATLTQIASSDFFDKPRTINDVIEHCKHNLARNFKANEFSSKLGRMVRGGELARRKNAEKQYEYKKP